MFDFYVLVLSFVLRGLKIFQNLNSLDFDANRGHGAGTLVFAGLGECLI